MPGSLSGLTVLIVDPDTEYALALGYSLMNEGATVNRASSGLDAAATTTLSVTSVVISELMLPGQTGVDLLTSVRDRPSAPPVIILTANHSARLKTYTLAMGAANYFVKPADPAALSRAILVATGTP